MNPLFTRRVSQSPSSGSGGARSPARVFLFFSFSVLSRLAARQREIAPVGNQDTPPQTREYAPDTRRDAHRRDEGKGGEGDAASSSRAVCCASSRTQLADFSSGNIRRRRRRRLLNARQESETTTYRILETQRQRAAVLYVNSRIAYITARVLYFIYFPRKEREEKVRETRVGAAGLIAYFLRCVAPAAKDEYNEESRETDQRARARALAFAEMRSLSLCCREQTDFNRGPFPRPRRSDCSPPRKKHLPFPEYTPASVSRYDDATKILGGDPRLVRDERRKEYIFPAARRRIKKR